jgi:cytochrome c-type biogenesis protein CcmH/NrfF
VVVPRTATAQSGDPDPQTSQSTPQVAANSKLTICQKPINSPPNATDVERTEGQVSNVVQAMSQQIYSPYCPGKTLSMCPSGGAAAVRRDIQQLARQGWTTTAIREAILDACGEEYRFEEPPSQDNYLLMATVLLGLVLCIVAVLYFTRGDNDADGMDDAEEASLDQRDKQRLDDIRHEYRE